ncbi:MAG: phytanoyl-CoA dioxygenase family protein [Planctomycetaceae bacterium]
MPNLLTPQAPAHQLTETELNDWRRDGYVIVRGLAGDPLRDRMRQSVLDGLAKLIEPVEFEADVHYPGAPESRESVGGRTVRRLKQAHSRSPAFTEWIQHPGIIGRLRQMLGPALVCPLAHHNCIMTKSPQFSSETGWHQDIRYWSYEQPELVSVWLALGKEHLENGCLSLLPGTHRQTFTRDRLDDDLFLRPELPQNQALIRTAVPAELEPGDVLFFHARTFHAAGANRTSDVKLSVVFTYRSAENRPLPGSRSDSLPELLIPTGLNRRDVPPP